MSPRLLALAAAALVLPLLAAPAEAAPARGPETPTLAQVTSIYPDLAGSRAHVTHEDVSSIGPDCEDGEPIPGTRSTFGEYDQRENGDDLGSSVSVLAGAVTFRSSRDAATYLADFRHAAPQCFGVLGRGRTERIRSHVGQERFGLATTQRFRGQVLNFQVLMARNGRVVGLTVASGLNDAPTVPQAVRLTALTLRTAR